tara:strand:+ start:86 stop:310 length:225 start_codon:yes stop_codon:yes gene_type:complete
MENLKLNDEVIANIAKMVQIAILTGTDIVDNLRTIRLTQLDDSFLGVTEEFKGQLEQNISSMLNSIENHNSESN